MKSAFVIALFLPTLALANPFAEVSPTNPVCYERAYTETHLARHPKQTVKSMLMKFDKMDGSESGLGLTIRAQIKKNGSYKPYRTTMGCWPEGNGLKCGIDCDGGTAEVRWETTEVDGVVTFVNKGFMMYGGCGEETDEKDWIWLKPEAGGDDIFKLYKLPAKDCRKIRSN